jgi:hypothetical protein
MYKLKYEKTYANGVLLLYHHPLSKNAATILEHVESFARYSKFKVWSLNVAYGFPRGLRNINFNTIVLHYSLFGSYPYAIPEIFLKYIEGSKNSRKIVFFQDEMHHCMQRFKLINRLSIEVIYTLLDRKYFEEVYFKNTIATTVLPTLTGYVSDQLIEFSLKFEKPFHLREVDVGYRARQLPFYLGRGAQEKSDIAIKFILYTRNLNLKLDIKLKESDRIYGEQWPRFISNCRFMLGVESGTSIFDITGQIQRRVSKFLEKYPNATFINVEKEILEAHEGKIKYRTISPRIFECAALRTCMILFRGEYQNILIADRHYIPLEKDFSNFEEVILKMSNIDLVQEMTERAYQDLISSKVFSYSNFIRDFDNILSTHLPDADESNKYHALIDRILTRDLLCRRFVTYLKQIRYINFPGRKFLAKFAHTMGYKNSN